MNELTIGKFISQKRKEKNLTQEQLAEKLGIALQLLSHTFGGSNVKDFFSGLLLGISIAEMLVGVYVLGRNIPGKSR